MSHEVTMGSGKTFKQSLIYQRFPVQLYAIDKLNHTIYKSILSTDKVVVDYRHQEVYF